MLLTQTNIDFCSAPRQKFGPIEVSKVGVFFLDFFLTLHRGKGSTEKGLGSPLQEFQSNVFWPVLCMRIGEMIRQLPSAQSTSSCKHFSFCHSEFQGVRAALVNWAAHALGKANFEHSRSSLKLAWPWFKFHYISIVMDFQCLFSEWEPLKWNTMKCYRSVCKVITKAGRMVLPLRDALQSSKVHETLTTPEMCHWWLGASFHPENLQLHHGVLTVIPASSGGMPTDPPAGQQELPKMTFQGHTKDLPAQFTGDFLLPAAEQQLWTQCRRGQGFSAQKSGAILGRGTRQRR